MSKTLAYCTFLCPIFISMQYDLGYCFWILYLGIQFQKFLILWFFLDKRLIDDWHLKIRNYAFMHTGFIYAILLTGLFEAGSSVIIALSCLTILFFYGVFFFRKFVKRGYRKNSITNCKVLNEAADFIADCVTGEIVLSFSFIIQNLLLSFGFNILFGKAIIPFVVIWFLFSLFELFDHWKKA